MVLKEKDIVRTPFGDLTCTKIIRNENPIFGDLYILDGSKHLELYTLELLNNLDLWRP